jgi:hypothetical protein
MGSPDGLEQELRPGEWAAVGKLTGLVDLELLNAKFLTPTPESCAAISKLTKLQSLGAWLWSAEMLPTLAAFSCTQITRLVGGWRKPQDSSSVRGIALPGVVELSMTYGSPPFAALPNLITIEHTDCIATDAFASMAQHCTRLQTLEAEVAGLTLPDVGSTRTHTAAIKALSALTCLTHLEFMLAASTELFLLVDVVSGLIPKGLKHLKLLVYRSSPMRLSALMHLAKLQGLPELTLQVEAATADVIARDPATLLTQQSVDLLGWLLGVYTSVALH